MYDKLRYIGALTLGAIEFSNDLIRWHLHHQHRVKASIFVLFYPVTLLFCLVVLHLDLRNQ